MSAEVVTVGEMLIGLSGGGPNSLSIGDHFRVSVVGAESNVAIAVARLGTSAAWIGRVGNDEGGRLALRTLRAEGVDLTGATVDPETHTAILLKHRRIENATQVTYLRKGAAGSRLRPSDMNEHLIRDARILHVTGITPALGLEPAKAVLHAIAIARDAGTLVSFDVNYRSTLWTEVDARPILNEIAAAADIVFASPNELSLIGGDPLDLIWRGASEVVVKDGGNGATVTSEQGEVHEAARSVAVVDPVGAGDAFVGGYLAGFVRGLNLDQRLKQAVGVGGIAVSTVGDWEGLPHEDEMDDLLRDDDNVRR